MRTISIINLKGGVAKTTSSINIAYILTQRGYKVLLVDNDKQGDCSRGLNRRTSDGDGIDRIMTDRHPDMQSLIHNTDYDNLDIITANLGLLTANTKVTMDRVRPQQNRLKKALQQVSDQYDLPVTYSQASWRFWEDFLISAQEPLKVTLGSAGRESKKYSRDSRRSRQAFLNI